MLYDLRAGKSRLVLTTGRNVGFCWITQASGSKLVLNNYRVSNGTTTHIYDPLSAKLIDLDKQAILDFDKDHVFDHCHAQTIGQNADATALTMHLSGWGGNKMDDQYYLVSASDGRILGKGVKYQPATQPTSAPTLNAETIKKRDHLLAAAGEIIQAGVKDLAKAYPELAGAKTYAEIIPGKLHYYAANYHPNRKTADSQPKPPADFFKVMVLLITPEQEARSPIQMQLGRRYRHLDLIGDADLQAANPKLQAALEKLLTEALAPLDQLDRQLSDPRTGQATKPTTATASAPDAQAILRNEIAAVRGLWTEIRFAPGPQAVAAARSAIIKRLKALSPDNRLAIADSLIDANADAATNAAALDLLDATFGKGWFKPAWAKAILASPEPTASQAALLAMIYQAMGEGCTAASRPADDADLYRKQLVGLAIDHLETVAGATASQPTTQAAASEPADTYALQRLAVTLAQPALTCMQKSPDEKSYDPQWQAIHRLAADTKLSQLMQAYLQGWDAMGRSAGDTQTVDGALLALGHWDPAVRYRAAARLAREMEAQTAANTSPGKGTLARVLPYLDDRRDEVKAAAAMTLAFAASAGDAQLTRKLTTMVLQERSVLVQQAAADALAARAGQAKSAIYPFLDVFETSRPGRHRTEIMLGALAQLAPQADDQQARRLAQLAMAELNLAPHGALELVAALGNQGMLARTGQLERAQSAVNAYLARADRANRQYIERHVLPAIKPQPASGPADHGDTATSQP